MQLGPVFGLAAVVITAFTAELGLGAWVVAVPFAVGSLPLLGLTRLLEGASTAASVPSVLGYIAAATSGDEELRGRAAARFEVATIGGLALGFAAAGPLWALVGPLAFLLNALVYALALGLYRWLVPGIAATVAPAEAGDHGWTRYRRLLQRSRVWLLAPTWVALNAGLGLYTSQTLFQLVRTPDERFAGQWLVGGLAPVGVTLAFLAGGGIFFLGLLFWGGRFAVLRRTTMIYAGIAGGSVFVAGALVLNHADGADAMVRLPGIAALAAGLFLLAAATPAALGLLADMSESFPADRGAVMGLYSVFLGLGQIAGAFIGALAAELWAFDGILVATLVLLGVALLPLSRLRRFELAVQPSPASGPDPEATLVDLSVTTDHRMRPPGVPPGA
jgi:MFS family permease